MSTENMDERTSARATAKFVRVAPFKARRVIDLIRGKSVDEAASIPVSYTHPPSPRD